MPCIQTRSLPPYPSGLRQRLKALLTHPRKLRLFACGWIAYSLGIQASSNTINFRGELITASCQISALGEANGEGMNMAIDFGKVALADLRPPGVWVPSHGRNFTLVVTCPGEMPGVTRAIVTFEAAAGSGLDPDEPSLLALSADSVARGAGIGLWSPADGTALDLSTRPVLKGLFASAGDESIAKIVVAALYSRTAARAMGGSANAALPVGLSYE